MPSSDFSRSFSNSSAKHTAFKRAEHIEHLLEEGRSRTSLSRSAFFTQSLRVWDALLRETELDEYLNTICVGVEKAMTQIVQVFDLLLAEAVSHYLDILAVIYMRYGLRANSGEEYTPWDLVQLMARLTLHDFVPPAPDDQPCTFYDLCCGSGSTLLGCMEYLDIYYPEVLDRDQATFYGQDASFDAYLMARINLRLHVLGRALRCQTKQLASMITDAEIITPDHSPTDSSAEMSILSLTVPQKPYPLSATDMNLVPVVLKQGPDDELSVLFSTARQKKRSSTYQVVQQSLPGFVFSPEAGLERAANGDDIPSIDSRNTQVKKGH